MKKSESLPSVPALRAVSLIDRLGRLMRSGEHVGDLNPAQWEALRYLARANRFSRTPAALAQYLGSTRGTVSQTLIALEAKGYVEKHPSGRDGRSVDLDLTAAGRAVVGQDALRAFGRDVDAGADAARLASLLEAVLRTTLARRGGRAFGACHTCRHFRTNAAPGAAAPHHCSLLDEPLSAADAHEICVEQS